MLLEADLPDDVDALRGLVLEHARALADITEANSKADARIEGPVSNFVREAI